MKNNCTKFCAIEFMFLFVYVGGINVGNLYLGGNRRLLFGAHGFAPRAFTLQDMNSNAHFRQATSSGDFTHIAVLADTIWREHYTPIIGKAQVDYMLEQFQSEEAIARQVADAMRYYLILVKDSPVGYLAIQKRSHELFLSKIYLLREYRGQGTGKAAMVFIVEKALEIQCDRIVLTVNKNNHRSIQAYSKMGFENKGALVTDIGGGFVMDDYLMVKVLKNKTSGTTGNSPA